MAFWATVRIFDCKQIMILNYGPMENKLNYHNVFIYNKEMQHRKHMGFLQNVYVMMLACMFFPKCLRHDARMYVFPICSTIIQLRRVNFGPGQK